MGDRKPVPAFGRRERGIDRPLTRDPPVDEAARARAVPALRDKFRADVDGLIKLGGRLHKEFVSAGTKLPLVRRTAATELLRVYKKLKDFESSLPRGPGGILMQKIPFKQQPVPWPGRPKSLAAILPFSDKNVQAWRAAASEFGPPLPTLAPRPVVSKPPKVVQKASAAEHISASLIKVPGFSLATSAGRTRILANVLRVFSHQALPGDGARTIATQMDLLKYLVLAFEETLEQKTRSLESFPVGHEYSVKLRKEFLADAQKLTSVPLDANQRWTLNMGNNFSFLYRPDNSRDEKFWYARWLMTGTKRDPDSGYMPGEVVSNDGIIFLAPHLGDSMFMAPGGELYLVKQASRRDQLLEAFRVGVLNSAGGVILGGVILAWAVVAIGAAVYAAPAVAAATSTWIAGMVGGGTATSTAVYQSIITHRFVQWLGLNWPAVLAKGSFYVGLGGVAIDFDARTFVRLLRDDPEAALKMLAQTFAQLGHSYMEAHTAVPGGRGYRSSTPDPDLDPPTAPVPPRTLPPAVDPDPVVVPAPTPPPVVRTSPLVVQEPAPTPNTVLKRMTGDTSLKDGKPANENRMTNPSTQADVAEAELVQAPAVVVKRTGTDDGPAVVGDQTTGVTMSSRTRDPGSTTPNQGSVVSTTGTQKDTGRSRQTPAGGDDDPTRSLATSKKTQPAINDNQRGIASGNKPVLNALRSWKPVAPPPHPQYANPNASVAERLRFIANADLALVQGKDPSLGLRQRTQRCKWTRQLQRGEITEADILNPPKDAPKNRISLASMESTIDDGLKEQFRHRLALATGVHVVSVPRSDNVGDQAADLQAQLAGRPRAYSFVTATADGRRVQIDDFDFNTSQFIEYKSLTALVPPNAPRDVKLREYREQMEKGAIAARDNGVGPVKWVVPPDVDLDLVDYVYRLMPPGLRKYVHIPVKPAAPIR
jgi:hypothetical protein